MGKKKGRKSKHVHTEMHFAVPPHVAGVAAATLKQVATPAFQQLIARSLDAAGQAMEAMAQRSAGAQRPAAAYPAPPEPPVPPVPPVPPMPPVPPEPPVAAAAEAAYRPGFETPPIRLSPEAVEAIDTVAHQAAKAIEGAAAQASQAIEAAAAAFERWAERQGRDRPAPPGE